MNDQDEAKSKNVITSKLVMATVTTIMRAGSLGYEPETGIRYKSEEEWPNFRLIQHGCWDLKYAHRFICLGLAKGWDAGRIDKALEYAKTKFRRHK